MSTTPGVQPLSSMDDFAITEEVASVATPDSDSGIGDFQQLSPEDQDRQREEWKQELAKVEEEIQTLRQVLVSKVKQATELKRKLGITAWKEFQDDMNQGIRNVRDTPAYIRLEETFSQFHQAVTSAPLFQKTESAIKATAEKTTTFLGGLGSGITTKIGQLKNSDSFRSIEEKVGTAYENVKTKVSSSRSGSVQSFDDALKESESRRANGTPATTPIIPEDKPLS